jgi:hypothetical protein
MGSSPGGLLLRCSLAGFGAPQQAKSQELSRKIIKKRPRQRGEADFSIL